MSRFGGIPVQQGGSKFGGVPVAQGNPQSNAQRRYAAEDAAREAENRAAPWHEQLGTGIRTQAGRTMLGLAELARNLDEALPAAAKSLPVLSAVPGAAAASRALFTADPEVLAEAQREADRSDKGTGVAGAVGNVAGDFRNYLPIGPAAQAVKAKTLAQAVRQGAAVGSLSGALSGLTEATGEADSTLLTNLGNAGIGAALGGAGGALIPAAGTAAKAGGRLLAGGADRALSALGSDAAAERVAYGNIARILRGQGYTPGEVAGVIDEFRAQGIDGGTLGQMLQSSDLLAREKNLLQGGGKAGRVMGEKLAEQPRKIAESVVRKVRDAAQPDQTTYLYRQAAALADAPTSPGPGTVTGMGRSATQQELPFTLNAIEQDLAARADELPPTVLKRVQKILAAAKNGGFEAYDTAKKQLDDLYKPNSQTTDQDIVNGVVLGYRRMLNASLEKAGGTVYTAAKESAARDLAMREAEQAVTGTRGVKSALNTFFGSLEQQEEFLRKLPEPQRREFVAYLENLQRVSGRFGGSDTASNTATQRAMNAETGFGFDANLVNPQTWADRLAAPISRNVRRAQAEVTFAPDADRLANAMRPKPPVQPLPPAVARVLATEAAKAAIPPDRQPPPDTPPTPPPRSPRIGPQSNAAPLAQRMAMAESSGNPDAKNPNSTASGLFQFTDDTWAQSVAKWGKELGVTLKDKGKPEAQRAMAEKLAADNARILGRKLGRPVTDGEVYAAHFLGASDAEKLIKAQGTGKQAILLFSRRVTNDNRPIFFDGKRPRSVEEVMDVLNNKVT